MNDHAQRNLSVRLMRYGVALAIVGSVFMVFTLRSPFSPGNFRENESSAGYAEVFWTITDMFVTFGLPFAAALICLSIGLKSAMTMPMPVSQLKRRLLTAGIIVAGAGYLFASYSASVLIGFGATIEQGILFDAASLVSRVWVQFGMPLAAGLICLSIAFNRIASLKSDTGAAVTSGRNQNDSSSVLSV